MRDRRRLPARIGRGAAFAVLAAAVLTVPSASAVEDGPIYVRPGAPGEPTQRISPASVAVVQQAPYSHHEVHFMQHMIVHHGQAVTMAEMALDPEREGVDDRILSLARQIDITQDAEISQMTQWLQQRDEDVPDPYDTHGHEGMPGMVSHEEMAALDAAEGNDFNVRFLEAMISHHEGAIVMVEQLEEGTGSYMEPNVRIFSMDVVDHQSTELKRMRLLLEELRA